MPFVGNTGDYEAKRGDMFVIDPRGLVIDYRKNIPREGIEPPVDDELISLARSMLPKDRGGRGQLAPIKVRPLHDRRLEVYAGFRRTRAALWLIESGECPDFKIAYTVSRVTDQEAVLDNFAENLDRLDPKPIQMARAIRSMEESYHLTPEEIAKQINRPISWVNRTRDLVMLPEPIQDAVAADELSAAAAREFAELPAKEAMETFNALRDSGERVSATAVKDAKRAKREKAAEKAAKNGDTSTGPATIAPVKRSWANVRAALKPRGDVVSKAVLDFAGGLITEKDLDRVLDKAATAMRAMEPGAGKAAKGRAVKAPAKKSKRAAVTV